ncbi:MAG: TSUP family transporter [Elusimicrobia bacterium]|nr:TSUP family transporter [Elusimicrobiota bacterium]
MLPEFSAAQLLVLAPLIFFAGVVDALAGGGGLITLPAYLAAGLDPALLLGTNKLASGIGTVASAANYWRGHRLKLGPLAVPLAACVLGSLFGARLSSRMDPNHFKFILLTVLPIVGWLVHSRRHFGREDRSAELGSSELERRSSGLGFAFGAYDGFLGPGTGTFFALGLSRWCRYDLLGSTARAKFLNLATNLAALAFFLHAGRVHLRLGLSMGAVSVLGHWTGSHMGLKKGADAIRPMVILVCAGLFAKLLLDCLR